MLSSKTLIFCLLLIPLNTACVKTPITGRSVFIVTSEAQEAELGKQAYGQILAKSSLSKNRDWSDFLTQASHRITAVAKKVDYKWEFNLIESKERNAFCLPGGKIAIYTGMMREFVNEGELAAVLGHEVGHATARHAGQRITAQFGTDISFSVLSSLIGGGDSKGKNLLMAALGVGTTITAHLPFSRFQELEADYIGLIYMSEAGYNPNAAISFWEHFANGSGHPEFLSTHPSPEHRRQELQSHLGEALTLYESSPKYGNGNPTPVLE